MSHVLFGIDQVLATPGLVRGRLALVTNDAARTALDPTLRSRVALQHAGFDIVRLFSPEHGLGADAADGAAVKDCIDPRTGRPVVSLYGEEWSPPRKSLEDLDAVVFDIPDIGARFYTYIWTLSLMLEGCAETGVSLVVLDRPNPLSGDLALAEGPILDTAKFRSFVGRAAIPIRHSLTVGELARLWNSEWQLKANLEVVRCRGWTRAMHWPDNGLPFVQTSPAIASYESALLYPGICLFEATNLSLGRGTDLPFRFIGAPWLRAEETASAFNAFGLAGVRAEPCACTPSLALHSGVPCQGVCLGVTDARLVRPVSAGLHLLALILHLHPAHFQWARYPTAANPGGENHFERLIGQAGVREVLSEFPADLTPRIEAWTSTGDWPERAKGFLLYD